jgi:hypothetical protein
MFAEPWSLSINRRCWEEALSVQDRLTPASPRVTWRTTAQAWHATALNSPSAPTRHWLSRVSRGLLQGPAHPLP